MNIGMIDPGRMRADMALWLARGGRAVEHEG